MSDIELSFWSTESFNRIREGLNIVYLQDAVTLANKAFS